MRKTVSAVFIASLLPVLAGCVITRHADGSEGLLHAGTTPPELSAVDQQGKVHRLSEERGHALIVYFYPKDNTPGCTKEACAFRDTWTRYEKAGVQVFGVSSDDQKSHEAFAKEQHLPFPILADPDENWIKAFGVTTRLGMASRVSFLLDKNGKIAKVYPDVDPGIHADEVLKDAAALP